MNSTTAPVVDQVDETPESDFMTTARKGMRDPSSWELMILDGLQRMPNLYGGMVPASENPHRRTANTYEGQQARRARNKRARAARRIHRHH